jgi:hypothetical protein
LISEDLHPETQLSKYQYQEGRDYTAVHRTWFLCILEHDYVSLGRAPRYLDLLWRSNWNEWWLLDSGNSNSPPILWKIQWARTWNFVPTFWT